MQNKPRLRVRSERGKVTPKLGRNITVKNAPLTASERPVSGIGVSGGLPSTPLDTFALD